MSDQIQPVQPEQQEIQTMGKEQVVISFTTTPEDVLQAVEVVDLNNRFEMRRNIQGLGVALVLWMFIPELFRDPSQISNWVMSALAVALLGFVWKYPEHSNRKFAAHKAAQMPKPTLEITADSIEIFLENGEKQGSVLFSGDAKVCEFKDVFAVTYDKNHLLTIPKTQLEETQLEHMRRLFRQGLGDGFEKREPPTKRKSLFGGSK